MKTLQSTCVKLQIDPYGAKFVQPRFKLSSGWVSPYAQAPWCRFSGKRNPTLIDRLTGDFFCIPYGWNATPVKNRHYPLHGESAQEKWQIKNGMKQPLRSSIECNLQWKVQSGQVKKEVELLQGHLAIYQTIKISGTQGPMTWATHPMIQVPEGETALLSLAPFQFGSTFPGQFLDPATGGYSSLKGSSPFKSLEKVPLNSGGSADLSQYPARSGFDDLVITGNKPKSGIGWAAVVLPHSGYLWYSLKKTVDFPLTILWFSNGGYHPSPWNGSLKRVVAVEETSGIPQGLFESVSPNIFQNRGIKTFENLSSKSPRILRHVQGICEIPRHFGKVKSVDFSQDKIIFIDLNGKKTSTLFNSDFLEL